ncbi:MAG: phage terminase small subunit P27 family [Chloroflexi bacterium]|nr:phage terminase small subunit P27 family [Chloroflexota bacterium]
MRTQRTKCTVVTGAALLFAGYCETYAWRRECKETLELHGTHYLDGGGRVRQRPEVAIARVMLDEMRELGAEFGLTPAARLRLALPSPEEEPDEFELFLAGKSPQRRD